jgi:glycosyltransferase involved in cell wall biosynthesis
MYTTQTTAVTVTAVIPAYNAERFVTKAIDSVLAQDNASIEIIVVDDCSKDGTSTVLAPYVASGRVRLIRHEVNKGVSAARNTAIRHSSGKYIAFLDADDQWLPHHISTAVELLERHGDLDVVLQNFDVVDMDTGAFLGNWFAGKKDALALLTTETIAEGTAQRIVGGCLSTLIQDYFLHLQAIVARKKIFDQVMFDERLKTSEDVDWSVRATHLAKASWAYVSASSGLYFRHANSLTTSTDQNNDLIARTGVLLCSEYLQWSGLGDVERGALRHTLVASCLDASYYARLDRRWRDAWKYWGTSLLHGVSMKQAVDGAKLLLNAPQWMLG